MHFKIGDTVAVLDDTLKGTVMAIDKNTVEIKGLDGMTYFYNASELISIRRNRYELSKFNDNDSTFLSDKDNHTIKKNTLKAVKSQTVIEVDLHMHQLKKTTQRMDNFDMLMFQLNTAKAKLDSAIRKKVSKIIFIHGVGERVLKTELRHLLDKYPVTYDDASYQKYGWGATEVVICQ
ncbi:MAG: DNA mismatch repair protein MutS [Flavobacteriaceae bacterium]|nr:MAG: DNA mismatch repair protein MutS [Flavobacteriaceae bacterium]